MKIYKTHLTIAGEDGTLRMDTIEHEGEVWAVPNWLEFPSTGKMQPQRMICLTPFGAVEVNHPQFRWQATAPVPRFLFADEVPTQIVELFRVLESPEVWFDIPDANE